MENYLWCFREMYGIREDLGGGGFRSDEHQSGRGGDYRLYVRVLVDGWATSLLSVLTTSQTLHIPNCGVLVLQSCRHPCAGSKPYVLQINLESESHVLDYFILKITLMDV